jgi:predicted metal-dependent HD superfamily phosphohydrolase
MRVAEYIFGKLWDYIFDGEEGTYNDAYDKIVDRYTGPNRFYHDLNHIEEGVLYLYEFPHWPKGVTGERMKFTAILAFFYHDFVDPIATAAEIKSALAMQTEVYEWVDCLVGNDAYNRAIGMVDIAYTAICDTETHISDSMVGKMVVDADLMRFVEGDWRVWAEQIRKEYAHHPDELFNPGRRIVLEHFRSRSPFFYFVQHRDCDAYRKIDEQLAELDVLQRSDKCGECGQWRASGVHGSQAIGYHPFK